MTHWRLDCKHGPELLNCYADQRIFGVSSSTFWQLWLWWTFSDKNSKWEAMRRPFNLLLSPKRTITSPSFSNQAILRRLCDALVSIPVDSKKIITSTMTGKRSTCCRHRTCLLNSHKKLSDASLFAFVKNLFGRHQLSHFGRDNLISRKFFELIWNGFSDARRLSRVNVMTTKLVNWLKRLTSNVHG